MFDLSGAWKFTYTFYTTYAKAHSRYAVSIDRHPHLAAVIAVLLFLRRPPLSAPLKSPLWLQASRRGRVEWGGVGRGRLGGGCEEVVLLWARGRSSASA